MARAALLLISVTIARADNVRRPRFSWATVPVFFHSCNMSGPFSDAAIAFIAERFPLVTIEKGQGIYDATSTTTTAEERISTELARVKRANPTTTTLFYVNAVLDWPWYELHDAFEAAETLYAVDAATGAPCATDGDSSFPNSTGLASFDFSQSAARDLWTSDCANVTAALHVVSGDDDDEPSEKLTTAVVDGCFVDRATGKPGGCALASADAYDRGRDAAIATLARDRLVVANEACAGDPTRDDDDLAVHSDLLRRPPGGGALVGAMLENFQNDEPSIRALRRCARRAVVVECHHYYEDGGAIEDVLAAFLIGAGPFSYFAASSSWDVASDPIDSTWIPGLYDRPLGEPLGDARKLAPDLYYRAFAAGTTVAFNTTSGEGDIRWAGDVQSGVVQFSP